MMSTMYTYSNKLVELIDGLELSVAVEKKSSVVSISLTTLMETLEGEGERTGIDQEFHINLSLATSTYSEIGGQVMDSLSIQKLQDTYTCTCIHEHGTH
jgi:hypothetical protein